MTQPNPSPNSFMQQNERESSNPKSQRKKGPSGRMSRWPCKDYLKGTCTISSCEKWHPPECLFYKTKSGCRFGEKFSCAHRQVDEQPSKRSKKNCDKSAVAMLKKHPFLNLRNSVFFHFSVLMHPEPHTDLDNLNTMQHNLRTSAKRSNDACDVSVSLTGL